MATEQERIDSADQHQRIDDKIDVLKVKCESMDSVSFNIDQALVGLIQYGTVIRITFGTDDKDNLLHYHTFVISADGDPDMDWVEDNVDLALLFLSLLEAQAAGRVVEVVQDADCKCSWDCELFTNNGCAKGWSVLERRGIKVHWATDHCPGAGSYLFVKRGVQ